MQLTQNNYFIHINENKIKQFIATQQLKETA